MSEIFNYRFIGNVAWSEELFEGDLCDYFYHAGWSIFY